MLAGLAVLWPVVHDADSLLPLVRRRCPGCRWPPSSATLTLLVLIVGWCGSSRSGSSPATTRCAPATGMRIWGTLRVLDEARTWLFPLYSSALTPSWLRAAGRQDRQGCRGVDRVDDPQVRQVNDHAFLADDTLIGCYELGGGWIRVEQVKIGKRAFVGNSGMAAPGRKVPKASLVAVLSAAPHGRWPRPGRPGWAARRPSCAVPPGSRHQPHLRPAHPAQGAPRAWSRPAGWCRCCSASCSTSASRLRCSRCCDGTCCRVLLAGGLMIAAGWSPPSSPCVQVAARRAAHKSRSTRSGLFVWRNELADTFIEVLAAPWFASATQGTVALNVWLRLLGAKIGPGVWCDTYWLPETDLVDAAGRSDGEPRLCRADTPLPRPGAQHGHGHLQAGATLGPNSVILPAATIGRHATVGPVSLVMRGKESPAGPDGSGTRSALGRKQ